MLVEFRRLHTIRDTARDIRRTWKLSKIKRNFAGVSSCLTHVQLWRHLLIMNSETRLEAFVT